MIRALVIDWLLATSFLFGFVYFVDKAMKKETAKWTSRFAWCGLVVAVIFGVIVTLVS